MQKRTRIVKRDFLTNSFQQGIKEHTSSDVLEGSSARLELQQAGNVHAVFALRIDGASIQVEITNRTHPIETHANNTSEVYCEQREHEVQFMMSVSTSLFLSTRMCAISEPEDFTIVSQALRMCGLYLEENQDTRSTGSIYQHFCSA